MHGERLRRMPRGFPADHALAGYLKLKQFLAGGEEPDPALALRPAFCRTLLRRFETLAPFVDFLNAPLVDAPRSAR